MSFEPVNIYLKDTTLAANPIVGATVAVYDALGTTVITQAVTDGSGVASFLLDSGVVSTNYSLRFFKTGVKFTNPKTISVQPVPTINDFDVTGELYVAPVSADPRICVAHGFFRTGSGLPARYVDMHFIPKFSPIILDGAAVMTERVAVRTDDKGYVEIPLIRYGQYDVLVEGREDLTMLVAVPNLANINIADLLLPVVSVVSFDPVGPFAVGVGATVTVTPTVLSSDGNGLTGTALEDVIWESSDPTIAVVDVDATTLRIRGVATGSCTLKATRRNQTIIRIPDTGISGQPVTITVS